MQKSYKVDKMSNPATAVPEEELRQQEHILIRFKSSVNSMYIPPSIHVSERK